MWNSRWSQGDEKEEAQRGELLSEWGQTGEQSQAEQESQNCFKVKWSTYFVYYKYLLKEKEKGHKLQVFNLYWLIPEYQHYWYSPEWNRLISKIPVLPNSPLHTNGKNIETTPQTFSVGKKKKKKISLHNLSRENYINALLI